METIKQEVIEDSTMFFALEQYFNIELFPWTLCLSLLTFVIISTFMFYKFLLQYFLPWDPISPDDEQGKIRKRNEENILIQYFWQHNNMQVLFWYWFIDSSAIYPTSFDFVVYFLTFYQMSYVTSCSKVLEKFISTVIDSQISFTPSTTLKKSELFQERVHKLILLQTFLYYMSLCTLFLIFGTLVNFEKEGPGIPWEHLIFLSYPAFENMF